MTVKVTSVDLVVVAVLTPQLDVTTSELSLIFNVEHWNIEK